MEVFVYIALGVIVGAFIAWVITRIFPGSKGEESGGQQGMMLLQNQIENLTKTIDSKLGESQRDMREATHVQFSESQKLIQSTNEQVTKHLIDVAKKVTEANEASKQVFTIADQLQNPEKV